MRNPFKKERETLEEVLVRCEKGHIFPQEQVKRYVMRAKDGSLMRASKNFCPICFIEFFNEHISGIEEV